MWRIAHPTSSSLITGVPGSGIRKVTLSLTQPLAVTPISARYPKILAKPLRTLSWRTNVMLVAVRRTNATQILLGPPASSCGSSPLC